MVGGLGRSPHAFWNASKPGSSGLPCTMYTFHLTTCSMPAPPAASAISTFSMARWL